MPKRSLWSTYADQFQISRNVIWLNHAAVSPLCKRAADAMRWIADDVEQFGSLHYEDWIRCYGRLREAAASLINAERSEIAIVKNTSEGISTIATGLKWRHGDVVVAFEEEFPSNFYPWKRLELLGVEVRWLSIYDSLEKIDAACRGARLLAISYVNYLSGHRVNLEAIGEICARRGALFLVDAIQGMGAFPIDVKRARIHALAADGHKWMMGPEGCGVLFVAHEVQDQIEPVEFGWTNTAKYTDMASRDMMLRPDAGRYECGTLNTAGCYGLSAALEFILEVGVGNIEAAVQERAEQIWQGVMEMGFEVLGARTKESGSGIVSFRKSGVDGNVILRRFREAKISAIVRQGWVRTAPHFYLSPDDIGKVLDVLQTI